MKWSAVLKGSHIAGEENVRKVALMEGRRESEWMSQKPRPQTLLASVRTTQFTQEPKSSVRTWMKKGMLTWLVEQDQRKGVRFAVRDFAWDGKAVALTRAAGGRHWTGVPHPRGLVERRLLRSSRCE